MIDRRTSPTLDDVLQVLASNEAMSPARLRDMRSAVRRIGQMIGKPLDRLPANLSLLRSLVNELTPAAHEVSVKTFANLRSNLMAAIRHAGLAEDRPQALTPEFEVLYHALTTPRLRHGLSRFLRWCSMRDLTPASLDARTVVDFRDWLQANALVKDPSAFARQAGKLWNEAAVLLPKHGLQAVTLPARATNRADSTRERMRSDFRLEP